MRTVLHDMPSNLNKTNERGSDFGDEKVGDIERDPANVEISELVVVAEGEEKATWFVWILVACCSISGLLLGYDNGIISGTLVSIGTDLGPMLSSLQKELITSATILGALLGGLAGGVLSDVVGRKPVLVIADVFFVGGVIGQAVSHTVSAMIGGRLLIGLAIGLAACIAPVYIQELTPSKLRGRMVVVYAVAITGGQVVAYSIGAAFENTHGGWRWMVGLGSVPAGLQFLFLFFLPESPRILLRRAQVDKAEAVMRKIYAHATDEQVTLKVRVLQAAVEESIHIANTTTFMQRVKSMILVPVNRRALIVACGLQAFQQFSGFNTINYYSATLFKSIGFNQPTAVGLVVSGTNFIFTFITLKYIDTVGRRKILIWSTPGMIFGLTLASIFFHFLTRNTGNVIVEGVHYSRAWAALVLLSIIIYVASFSIGFSVVPWLQGELFSLEVRGIGTSCAIAIKWAANLIIGSTYLSLLSAITPSGAFGFYAGLCLLALLFSVLCYPETAGFSLEEVKFVFKDGFGIKESARMRRMDQVTERSN